jgi:hypothetical protein
MAGAAGEPHLSKGAKCPIILVYLQPQWGVRRAVRLVLWCYEHQIAERCADQVKRRSRRTVREPVLGCWQRTGRGAQRPDRAPSHCGGETPSSGPYCSLTRRRTKQ